MRGNHRAGTRVKIASFLLFCISGAYAQSPALQNSVVEFSLLQSQVVYQLNRNNGSLVAVIKDPQGGVCLHKMDLKSRDANGHVFVYERNDNDRGKQYYQRFEVNLLASQASIFTSARNINSLIPIAVKACSVNNCSNTAVIAQCNY